MKVIWKKIPSFPHLEVSNIGDVRSIDRVTIRSNGVAAKHPGNILKKYKNKGYYFVKFRINGRAYNKSVARFVAEAFLGESNLTVNHINFKKDDNRIENLEYMTHLENMRHAHKNNRITHHQNRGWHPWTKIQKDQFKEVFEMKEKGMTQREIAKIFKVHNSIISRILNNKTKYAAELRKKRRKE